MTLAGRALLPPDKTSPDSKKPSAKARLMYGYRGAGLITLKLRSNPQPENSICQDVQQRPLVKLG